MIKTWIGKKLTEICIRWFPDYYNARVADVSAKTATRVVLDYLKNEGILHCGLCLKRSPLRKFGNLYYCPNHFNTVTGGVK